MSRHSRRKAYQKALEKSRLLAGMASNRDRSKNMFQGMDEDKVIISVADNVLAPALNGFVVWTLAQAMAQGMKRLYFLARDGYFMYQTACRYVKAYKLPVECRYLYCSRYSVRVPGYHLDTDKALSYITLGGLSVTAERLYERAGLDSGQRELLYRRKVLPYEKGEEIPRHELLKVKEILLKNSLFMEMLIENSQKFCPVYEKYLIQEGLLEEIPAALVDSGWVGSMQKELNQTLQRLGRYEQLSGFYWGLYELPKGVDSYCYHTYFFSPQRQIRRKVSFNNCLFEAIFTAPHGMTLFYKEEQGGIRPVLSDMTEERAERIRLMEELLSMWQEDFLQQTAERSFGFFVELSEAFDRKETCWAIEKNMGRFMHHPTREEAIVFGKTVFTDDVLERGGNQTAAKLSEKELRENHLLYRLVREFLSEKKDVRQSAWYEGSAAAYGKCAAYHIFQYTGYKYLLYIKKAKAASTEKRKRVRRVL